MEELSKMVEIDQETEIYPQQEETFGNPFPSESQTGPVDGRFSYCFRGGAKNPIIRITEQFRLDPERLCGTSRRTLSTVSREDYGIL